MELSMLHDYFQLQQELCNYFGYTEGCRAIPWDDRTGAYWMLLQNTDGSGQVCWSPEPFTEATLTEGMVIYSGSIYTQRHLPKWVYPTEHFTMICVDTHTDMNKFLMVFSNELRCEDAALLQMYQDTWGDS